MTIDLYSNWNKNRPEYYGLVSVYCGRNRDRIVARTLGDAVEQVRKTYGSLPIRYEGQLIQKMDENLVIGK